MSDQIHVFLLVMNSEELKLTGSVKRLNSDTMHRNEVRSLIPNILQLEARLRNLHSSDHR